MKKLMIGVALATCISSVAMAEEKKVSCLFYLKLTCPL